MIKEKHINMKNMYKIIMAVMLVSVVSCNDAIEIDQPGRLGADAAFRSVSDLRAGLLGAYNFLDTTNEIGFTASFTDEVFRGTDNGGQNLAIQNFNLNSTDAYVSSIWNSYYAAIGLANRIIAASETIDRSENPEDFDNVVAQAYSIRAFSHFQILTYFSTDYEDDSALAGLLLTAPTDDIFANVGRSTNGEFYEQIASDLAISSSLLNTEPGVKFMGRDFNTALRARIAAYRGQYTQADGFAASLLESYPIANPAQYAAMYEDADFTEVIFSLERSIGDTYDGQGTAGGGWAGSLFAFVDATDSGGPFMELSRSTYNILNGTPDIRLAVNVNIDDSSPDPDYASNPNFVNDDVLLVGKYPGGAQPLLNDLKVFRSAEMLLIRAEAAADAGNLVGAANFVKQLRDARFGFPQPLPTYANQTEAFGDILDERRLEFLLEGHRYVDLKRLGERGNRTIDRDDTECALLAACSIPVTDNRFTMPIPLGELTGNAGITQNPGY